MMDVYLVHHGVKGQQWHHRRWQYPDGSLTPEGYIHYGVNPSKKAGFIERRKNSYRYKMTKNEYRDIIRNPNQVVSRKPLTDDEKKSMGITNYIDNGGTLKKGSVLYRTTTSEDNSVDKPRYFSTSSYDAEKWSREFVPQISNYGKSPVVQDKYEISQEVKIASAAKLGEEWQKLWSEKYGAKSLNEIAVEQYSMTKFQRDNANIVDIGYGFNKDKSKYNPYEYGKSFTKEQSDKLRDLAASNLLMTSSKDRDALIDRLKKQGYGGVADINGIDVSYDPIIVFDTKTAANKVSSIPYTKQAIDMYKKLYYKNGMDKKYTEIKQIAPETRAGKKAIAQSLKSSGSTVDQIARAIGLSVGQVDGLLYGSW